MYARLTLANGWISWDAPEINTGFLALQPLPQMKVMTQVTAAARILADVFKTSPGPGDESQLIEERSRIARMLGDNMPWLTPTYLNDPERFDFVIRCAIAHHRLPPAERGEREARIAATVDGMLDDSPVWIAECGPRWNALKWWGIVLPDAVMEPELRTMAAHTVSVSCMAKVVKSSDSPMTPFLRAMRLPDATTGKTYGACFEIMANTYMNSLPADRPGVIKMVSAVLAQKQMDWVTLANEALLKVGDNQISGALHGDCLMNILRQSLTLKDFKLRQQVVQFELDHLMAGYEARQQQVVRASIDAVLTGVPLGASYTRQVLKALDDEREANDSARRDEDAAHLRARRLARRDRSGGADVDPVHAWSVERLLAWIEGPVTRQAIDRPQILNRERQRRQADAARRPPVAAQPAPTEEAHTDEDDVNLMVDDALQATAAFLRDDLGDMLALGSRLNLGKALLAPGMQMREALTGLASPDNAMRDDQACALLTTAEETLTQLRSVIKQVESTLKQRMGFAQAFHAAMQKEALAAGKRHGGVIAFPMSPENWAWVAESFHGRWLFRRRAWEVNGQRVPLRDDQALALYVTGSSQSQYAFDISVHLWQRRPGASCLPGIDSADSAHVTGLPRMNTDDWFDTYIPCAVLHVPQGR